MDGLTPIQYEVMAGQHNLHLPDLHEEVRRVKMGIMHPNYTWNDKEFDIGLVKLSSPLKFSDYIQVCCVVCLDPSYSRRLDYIPGHRVEPRA